MAIFYSASQKGFYPDFMKAEYQQAGNWPDDLKEISDRWFNYLLGKQATGKLIVPDVYGLPVLADMVIDWSNEAETQRQSLLTDAGKITADWKTEVQLDIISDDDKATLIKWMSYIKQLKALVFSDITDKPSFDAISWPPLPS